MQIKTRNYQPGDAKFLANIYYYTIHNINIQDYTKEQVDAWAPESSINNLEGWQKKWSKLIPIVATIDNEIVGFVEFEDNGHIDCFYVHHNFQSMGVGSALVNAVECAAKEKQIKRIFAEVSITAKPFFEAKGFSVVKKQTVNIRGCDLVNFVMEKIINL